MAALFDSFRNSSMPKRLLRYFLSRFDILDADAFNLDNLDLAWGMKTVLEFRDVGLKLKKLQQILQLPPTFRIRKAKVALLRVTLPVDIYSSPIQIQVTGVDVRLKVSSKDRDEREGAVGRRKDQPGTPATEDGVDAVPSAVDLAQSFLEQAPASETEALEAALAAETGSLPPPHHPPHHPLAASSGSLDQSSQLGSEYGDDDDDNDTVSSSSQALGIGQALTLPAIVADFLQGIVDRTQINIEDVTFQLEVDVPVDRPAAGVVAAAPESVTFQLALTRIQVEGVTTIVPVEQDAATADGPESSRSDADAAAASDRPRIVPKEGKRHITLDNVRAFLISEADVFSTLARSPSMPSSVSSQLQSQSGEPQTQPYDGSVDDDAPLASSMASMASSVASSEAASSALLHSRYPLQDSEEAFNIPYELDNASDGGDVSPRFGAEGETAPPPDSPLSTPRASVYGDVAAPPVVTISSSEPLPLGLVGLGLPDDALADSFHSSPGIGGHGEHDLAQSHVFSHEDAESMYMSAFSQTESVRLRGAMPGAWETEEHGHANEVVADTGAGTPTHQSPSASAAFPGLEASAHQPPFSPPEEPVASEAAAEDPPSPVPEPTASPIPVLAPTPVPLAVDAVDAEQAADSNANSNADADDANADPDATFDAGPPDEAATPRGPTRLVKEILSLKYISIYVPSNHKHIELPQQPAQHAGGLDKSATPHLPGAFSVYSSAGTASVHSEAAIHDHLEDSHFQQNERQRSPASDDEDDSAIEVNLAPLEISFDASIGFLLAMVVTELLQSLKKGLEQQQQQKQKRKQRKRRSSSRDVPAASSGSPPSPSPSLLPNLRFHAEKISFLFLEKLAGVADTAERFFESPAAPNLGHQSRDVLLQAVFENLAVAMSPTAPSTTTTTIDLLRFRFGYADADILSFDRRIQMRASVRDAFPPSGDDVSIKMVQTADTTKCEINTLPLLVSVDLQRLDETFSWFGGLSSFLSMGSSSVASVASVASPTPAPQSPPPPKPRGVRFETPINPDDKSAAAENKIDMRMGGVHLELLGKECSVALDTTAVKMVSREEGIGVGVSRIRLAGPSLRAGGGGGGTLPPVTAELTNTRLEFLDVPKDRDLERLLELITPSRVQFDEREDVIMIDTLLRQRRSGPLLRLAVDDVDVHVCNMAQLACLPGLGEEVARLGTVAKYLPEDDRPGLLTLGLVRRIAVSADVGGRLGLIQASLTDLEAAHITIPSLVSVGVGAISVHRNHTEELVGSSSAAASSKGPVHATSAAAAPLAALAAPPLSRLSPALMLRIIGDDMEPVIKIKMWRMHFEYRVPTIMDVLDLAADATPQDFEASLAASVANLGEQAHTAITGGMAASGMGVGKGKSAGDKPRPTTVDVSFRDCVVGLNPLGLTSKLNIVLVDARLEVALPQPDEDVDAVAHLNKMSLLLIDVANVAAEKETAPTHKQRPSSGGGTAALARDDMVARLCSRGFVDVCQISSARVSVHVATLDGSDGSDGDPQKTIDLEVRDDLLVLETCADSTQTLISLANALAPPTPPSKEVKFKTEVMPVKDLLASISIDAFGRAEGNYNFDEDFILEEPEEDETEAEQDLGFDENFYGGGGGGGGHSGGHGSPFPDQAAIESSVTSLPSVTDDDLLLSDNDEVDDIDVEGMSGTVAEQLFNASSVFSDDGTEHGHLSDAGVPDIRVSSASQPTQTAAAATTATTATEDDAIEFDPDFFGTASETAATGASPAHRWSSAQNGYVKTPGAASVARAPLRVRVRDVHVIWNLFDGYDWQHTRDVITKTVQEVEAKAYEQRTRRRRRSGHGGGGGGGGDQYNPYAEDEEEETVIGDFLFNSIYIGIPANHDPRDLAQAINQNIYGGGAGEAETESVAATTITAASSRAGGPHGSRGTTRSRKLHLQRSRRHKITFELGGVGADVVVFGAGSGETQSSIDVRVRDLDIFDHVPTSTWKKFATYDRDAGERPIDGDMVRLELLVVKPVPELAATEYVLRASLLPLRLHVDQDALDFITRFFEFKDETAAPAHASASDVPFIQRAEIRDIPVQLDFKPKRVDYAGLRSGHTTEFMNFLILDGSRMTLRHTIIYGVSGFERLGQTLNDIWMPDIKRHQLPGVLAGLAPVRSLVNVGSGFRDLIEIPIQEYRHNGRLVRAVSKGAAAFARSTGTELVKLGAKVATGTQYVLQGAEGLLGPALGGGPPPESASNSGGTDRGESDADDDAERKHISLYADQPTGVVQGLRHAYISLARDLNVARDAIIAVPAEVRETASATGAAKVVIKHAPTIIFRPAIGATKAIGQTLMGATNSLDPQNLRRAEDKYKSGPGRI